MWMLASLFPTSYVTSHITECWNFYKKIDIIKREKFTKTLCQGLNIYHISCYLQKLHPMVLIYGQCSS